MLDRPGNPDDDARALIERVGARVRAGRKAAGLTRRTLSEASGISPRYLAQIEGGAGNVSLAMLVRLASALEVSLEALLAGEGPAAEEAARVASLYRAADPGARAQVMRALDPERVRARKAERVCLIGLRGAGKTTLGRGLAKATGVPFVELTERIEAAAGMPMGEIIALYGQEGHRQLEAEAVTEVIAAHERCVLAVSGGLVGAPETFAQVLQRFHTVWIKAAPGEHMDRVRAQGDTRPMAGNPRALIQLRELLRARAASYAQADHDLDTSGTEPDRSLTELRALVRDAALIRDPGGET